jgi:hypothetical protein
MREDCAILAVDLDWLLDHAAADLEEWNCSGKNNTLLTTID